MEIQTVILIFAFCLIFRLVFDLKYRDWFIFASSIFSLFYFQPVSAIRYFDFWISSITLLLGLVIWLITVDDETKKSSLSQRTYFFFFGLLAFFGVLRLFPQTVYIKHVNIPPHLNLLIFAAVSVIVVFGVNASNIKKKLIFPVILVLIATFIVLKNPTLSLRISEILRTFSKQSTTLASSFDILWIGYSYTAFRMLHVLIDAKKKGCFEIPLHTFVGYLFFFPALLAGPIMRLEDYTNAVRRGSGENDTNLRSAFYRLGIGLFQKFVLADLLSIVTMDARIANTGVSPGWSWSFVITYALRIYLDFSGYTHIAIAIAMLLGIKMPENFDKPLTAPNITIFWNNWHMTLTQWFRAYYFNPVSRFLKRNLRKIAQNLQLAFMQITTMLLIGLWHGITWNYVLWGLWIGVGLFIQNLFTGFFRKRNSDGLAFWQIGLAARILSTTATFIYVSLGWIWFALPSVSLSVNVFKSLFGVL